MKILAIGAHPDDIEIGCAGMLIKYARKGAGVYLLVASDGSMGGDVMVRMREQERSARLIGAKKVFWGGYSDTRIPLDKGLIDMIEGVLKEIRPGFIFVNYPEDTHQDHRYLAEATVSATRYTRNVLFYEVPTSVNFRPNVFADITSVIDKKMQVLKAHASQVDRTNIQGLSILDIAKAVAHFRGTQARVAFAEGFHSLRLFINI